MAVMFFIAYLNTLRYFSHNHPLLALLLRRKAPTSYTYVIRNVLLVFLHRFCPFRRSLWRRVVTFSLTVVYDVKEPRDFLYGSLVAAAMSSLASVSGVSTSCWQLSIYEV